MPTSLHYRTIVFFTALLAMTAATAQEVNSSWRLRLMDLERQPKAEATLHFTGERVRSCMRGNWKHLGVAPVAGGDPAFFPLAEPMAYKLEHGVLTMSRTTACRSIPLLSAVSAARDIHGTARVVSVGRSTKLGLFILDPIE